MLLSQRTQASIIAALLRGEQPDFNPQDLTGVFREHYEWIQEMQQVNQPGGLWLRFLASYGRQEQHAQAAQLIEAIYEDPLIYPTAREAIDQLPDLVWLWHGWIPKGQITILMGDPSAGKSYLALDLAKRLAAGSQWPDGQDIEDRGNILYVDAENRPSVFKIRIASWADQESDRLFYMLPAANRMMIDFDTTFDLERFLDRVYRIRPSLIIIDSYSSISLQGENNKEDVQRILSFLTRVARDYDCAVVIIHHQRKRSSNQMTLPLPELSMANLRGSGHIAAMATSILGMQLVGSNKNGARSFQVVKNNLGRYPEPIGVSFTPWDENPEVAILSYGDVPAEDQDLNKIDQCVVWLSDLLEEMGPLPTDEIMEIADQDGYNKRMVYRARQRLAHVILDTRGPYVEGNGWRLAQDDESEDNQ